MLLSQENLYEIKEETISTQNDKTQKILVKLLDFKEKKLFRHLGKEKKKRVSGFPRASCYTRRKLRHLRN